MKTASWKRALVVVLAVLCIVAFPTGCAAPTPEPVKPTAKPEPTKAPKAEPTKLPEPVTIKWFMRWDQTRVENVAMPVIEAFQEQYPHITVEFENIGKGSEYYQKLQTMIAAGQTPDVFYPATYKAYAWGSKGVIMPIDDLMARDGINVSAFDPQIVGQYALEGKQMCLPLDTAALVVYYNKELFDEVGVDYPKAGWTWGNFLETAKAVTKDVDNDGVTDQFGVDQFRDYWPLMIWSQTGHNIFDDPRHPTKFLITDQESIDAIQWLADLMVVHNVMPTDEQRADIGDMFVAGKAAMQITGHWRVPRYTANAEFEWDAAPLPIGNAGVSVNRCDGSCFAVAATSKHPEEAWEFVKFLSGPGSMGVDLLLDLQQMVPAIVEFQQTGKYLSSHPKGINKEAFLHGDKLYGMYDPLHPAYDQWKSIWKQELGEVWLGKATAAEAVARMVPQVEEMLAHLEDYE